MTDVVRAANADVPATDLAGWASRARRPTAGTPTICCLGSWYWQIAWAYCSSSSP